MRCPLLAAIPILALGGCAMSMTLPVQGALQDSSQTFTGSATGYMDGGGKLTITTSAGTRCDGDFVYVTGREGEGTFQCTDGRRGPFTFVSTGTRGTGRGNLNGEAFTFTFGKPRS